MTEWHFYELASHLKNMTEPIKQADPVAPRTQGRARSTAPQIEDTGSDILKEAIDAVCRDIKGHRGEAVAAQLSDIIQTAHALAMDETYQPLYQARRIVQGDIGERITPLGQLRRPDENEKRRLDKDAHDWLTRFKDEIGRRGDLSSRKLGALDNDARSLAQIIWLSRQTVHDQTKLLFLTGDRVIFNAYRRWYLESQNNQPFVLRRLRQYTPIINLNDAESDLTGHRELFDQTRRAVEAALFLFNVKSPSADLAQKQPGREHLALLLQEPKSERTQNLLSLFSDNLNRLERNSMTELAHLVHRWQQMALVSIGVNREALLRRTEHEGHRLATLAATRPDPRYEADLARYMQTLVNDLVSGSIRLFFPFTKEYIASAARSREFGDGSALRVPLASLLQVPSVTEKVEGHDLPDRG